MDLSIPLERQELEMKIKTAGIDQLEVYEKEVAAFQPTDFIEQRLAFFLKLDIQERRRILAHGTAFPSEVE